MPVAVLHTHNLFAGVAKGDEGSFRELFHLYKQQVYSYAMHFTRSAAISEEIVQDVFLKLWIHREELDQIERFEAYLYTITRNLCFDFLKKLAHERCMKEEWSRVAELSEKATEAAVICSNYENLLLQAIDRLSPQQKKVYTLSFYEHRKYEEIAEYLHISHNTVKVHLAKARAAIRSFMTTHLGTIVLLLITLLWDLRL